MKAVFALVALLVVPLPLAGQLEPTRVAPRSEATMRPEIVGSHGIVAGGRHYSVHAGTRILEQGGDAIDAGVAAERRALIGPKAFMEHRPRRERYVVGW
jgi:hypothetical protein